MRAAKVQASLRIRAVSPEPSLLAHTSSESRGTFRQKARSLASLYGWACAVKICNDGMLEDTNSLDGARIIPLVSMSEISSHYLASVAAQADLIESTLVANHEESFSHDKAHFGIITASFSGVHIYTSFRYFLLVLVKKKMEKKMDN